MTSVQFCKNFRAILRQFVETCGYVGDKVVKKLWMTGG